MAIDREQVEAQLRAWKRTAEETARRLGEAVAAASGAPQSQRSQLEAIRRDAQSCGPEADVGVEAAVSRSSSAEVLPEVDVPEAPTTYGTSTIFVAPADEGMSTGTVITTPTWPWIPPDDAPLKTLAGTGPLGGVKARIGRLPEGSRVAVISFVGSFCPVTTAHVQCVVEARKILLRKVRGAPKRMERFQEVVGLMRANGDGFVSDKLAKKDPPVPIIPYEDRMKLIGMATEEYDWLAPTPREAEEELRRLYPGLVWVHCSLCGADDAVKYKKWNNASDTNIIICMGRPSDPGESNGTEAVVRGSKRDRIDLEAGRFILGPEMPEVSSSAVRKALLTKDVASLKGYLHPEVMAWNLAKGPYKPRAEAVSTKTALKGPHKSVAKVAPAKAAPAIARPLGVFTFWRGVEPFVTKVRKSPTDSRDKKVFHPDLEVADEDAVCLGWIDDTKRFGLVHFDGGEGWVSLKYLCFGKGSTKAIHQRSDHINSTRLRLAPDDARDGYVPCEPVANGERVTLIRSDRPEQWQFFEVSASGGRKGWLKVEHVLLRGF